MCCVNSDCLMKIFGWSNSEACIQTGPLSLAVERVAGGGGSVSDLAPSLFCCPLSFLLLFCCYTTEANDFSGYACFIPDAIPIPSGHSELGALSPPCL